MSSCCTKSKTRPSIALIPFIIAFLFFSVIAGCNSPFVAQHIHRTIKSTMNHDEVIQILNNVVTVPGFHTYRLSIHFPEQKAKNIKAAKFLAKKYKRGLLFTPRLDNKSCMHFTFIDQQTYLEARKDMKLNSSKLEIQKTSFLVLYMGPVFLKNSFQIDFVDDLIISKSELMHWD